MFQGLHRGSETGLLTLSSSSSLPPSLPLSLYSHVDTKELCGKYLDLQPPRCGQDYPEVGKAVWTWVGLVGGPQGEAGILCDP